MEQDRSQKYYLHCNYVPDCVPILLYKQTGWLVRLLGRPERSVPDGLMFYPWCMYLFFSPCVLRAPSTDRPETLPHDRNLAVFYNATPKIPGRSPKKIWGQKRAKFRSILDHFRLWPRISPEQGNISKIGKTYELGKFLLRLTKKVRWTLVP